MNQYTKWFGGMPHAERPLCWNLGLSHLCTILYTLRVQSLFPGTAFIQNFSIAQTMIVVWRGARCLGACQLIRTYAVYSLPLLLAQVLGYCLIVPVLVTEKTMICSEQPGQRKELYQRMPYQLIPTWGFKAYLISSTHSTTTLYFSKSHYFWCVLFFKLCSQLWSLL